MAGQANCYGCATQRRLCKHDSSSLGWRDRPVTAGQESAIFNIRFALGLRGKTLHEMPENRGEASDEIRRSYRGGSDG